MKKILYGAYILLMAGVMIAYLMKEISVDTAFMFYLGVGIVVLLFCVGGFFPMKMSPYESAVSFKNKVEARNDPIPWLGGLYMMIPVVLGIVLTYIL